MGLARLALILALGAGAVQPVRPPDHTGFAVRYAPGRMGRTASNRGIAWAPHMAAYTFARDGDMGRLWLHIKGPAGEADFLVVDLPQPGQDKRVLIGRGVVAEVDYESGDLICGEGWTGRARDCKIKVWIERGRAN
jgi:hypothetical protein